MFNLICVAIVAMLGFVPKLIWGWTEMVERCGRTCEQVVSYNHWTMGVSIAIFVIAIIWLVLTIVATFDAYAEQVKNGENIVRIMAKIKLAKAQWTTMSAQLTTLLAKAYPEHEKALLSDLKPEQVQTYGAKFPELKASETFLKLAEELGAIYNRYLELCGLLEERKYEMRYLVKNPWIPFSWLFPKLDEAVAKVPAEDMID